MVSDAHSFLNVAAFHLFQRNRNELELFYFLNSTICQGSGVEGRTQMRNFQKAKLDLFTKRER